MAYWVFQYKNEFGNGLLIALRCCVTSIREVLADRPSMEVEIMGH